MIQSLDMTAADSILKELYDGQKLAYACYKNFPAYAQIMKDESFRGRNYPLPIQYGNPQGRSATFSTAQSNTTPPKFKEFLLTRVKDYGVATVDGETLEATEGDNAAFAEALVTSVDGIIESVSASIATAMYRSGTGSIGQVGSGYNTKTITLSTLQDVVNFEVGMTLQANATDGGTPRTGTEVLAGVNRIAGTLTATSAAWNTVITALANSDYLLVQGDNNAKLKGFDGWIPATAPSSGDSWFNVDRSSDSRLYGTVYDATTNGDPIDEALINGQSLAARETAELDVIYMNPIKFRDLIKVLQGRSVYERVQVPAQGAKGEMANLSFKGITFMGDFGPITVVSDPRCQASVAWGITKSTVGLYSIGPAPKMLMKDGLRIQRQATADGYEVRVGMYAQVGFSLPGKNVRIILN